MSDLISNYKILPEQNLVIQHHSGAMTFSNYTSFAQNLYADSLYNPNLNHLINIKEVFIKVSLGDLNKYAEFSKNNFKKPKTRNIAVVTKTPDQVVLSTLFKILSKRLPQNIEIFSTQKAAAEWLKIDPSLLNTV